MAALQKLGVYLEIGTKRVFAGMLDWPGWCRSAKGEQDALQALFDYAPRYAKVLRSRTLGLTAPVDPSAFKVTERLEGDASTEFGVPGKIPKFDEGPLRHDEIGRLNSILKGCWSAFDSAVEAASGKTLRKGPRGGGRDLDKIVRHVLEAEGSYLTMIEVKHRLDEKAAPQDELARIRKVILQALSEAVGVTPIRRGPRGGARWPPRYYVRRSAWHVLDHAWEIEDRSTDSKGAA
jgi:hypothetical protein